MVLRRSNAIGATGIYRNSNQRANLRLNKLSFVAELSERGLACAHCTIEEVLSENSRKPKLHYSRVIYLYDQ